MKDFLGKELELEDEVVYVHYSAGSKQYLRRGRVSKIKKVIGKEVAYVNADATGVTSQNIYKI